MVERGAQKSVQMFSVCCKFNCSSTTAIRSLTEYFILCLKIFMCIWGINNDCVVLLLFYSVHLTACMKIDPLIVIAPVSLKKLSVNYGSKFAVFFPHASFFKFVAQCCSSSDLSACRKSALYVEATAEDDLIRKQHHRVGVWIPSQRWHGTLKADPLINQLIKHANFTIFLNGF